MERAVVFLGTALGWLVMTLIGAVWGAIAWLLDGLVGFFRRD